VATSSLLVDREREIAELRHLAASGQKQLAILYGRRQVGKTHLLSHVWGEARVFYFLAAALTLDLNRQDLLRELAAWSGQALDPADYPSWRTVFRELLSLAEAGPTVVVLDEFQYLLADEDQITSQLVAVWDRAPRTLPLTLVLSGSEVSSMAHLHAGGEPLYGRVTWAAQLHPFDYRDAARMAPWLERRDAAYLYGILGGTPRYLAALRAGEPLADGVIRTYLSPHGEVHLQMLSLIEQEKGIRQPAEYRAVLTAVAGGRTELNQITTTTGLEEHVVRRALGVLADLGLVRGERNFGASKKAAYRYGVADNAVGFWHRFLVPLRSRLATDDPGRFWSAYVVPGLDTYMGRPFEAIVRQAYTRYHAKRGLPAAQEWGRWEGAHRERRGLEVDIVGRLEDGRLLAGEVKWSSSPHGPGLHAGLLGKLARLAAAGQGWARDVDDAVFLYASAAGFTPEMVALATADPRVTLLTLADLYPEE
jgi:AAA+ ATPase superfamily predicted ATPase